KAFGDNVIIKNSSIEIDRGDKIALIGANGKGKSTLLRIIAGVENFSEGERKWGHNVEESFYAQHQLEALNVNNTILDEMKECGSQMTELELRGLLGCFLFSGDDSDKKIKILSGGEKARVALAKVIVSKANFLMLDEPTNHLDMHSCDLLIDSLNKYEGSIILVSHDRYFVSKTANKIWEIVNHEIKEFKGGYEEWVQWKERMQKAEETSRKSEEKNQKKEDKKQEPVVKQAEPKKESNNKPPYTQPVNTPVSKETKKELQKQQRIFQQVEEKLAELNKKKSTLESAMTDPSTYSDKNKFLQTEKDYNATNEEISRLSKQYEEVFEKIIALESAAG
ncbi:MAG: ATP-binding cassette domain-containing protein, partial [Bacteroidota bacterium]